MRTLTLGKLRRARVWIGEVPPSIYEGQRVVARTWTNCRGGTFAQQKAAVELFVPTGPKSMYGLLGAEVTPDIAGTLKVDVSVSTTMHRVLSESVLWEQEQARVGLLLEYAEAVFEGIGSYNSEGSPICAGRMKINCAAHGDVSSCPLIFKHLATILLKTLNTTDADPSDESLAALFPASFS